MGLNFVAIDFEIAAPQWDTPCSVAMVRVRDGQITESWSSLIDPETEFGVLQTRVHGITSMMVAGAPKFPEIAPRILEFIGSDVLIAHNVPFDAGVLHRSLFRYRLSVPEIRIFCTYAASMLMNLKCSTFRLPAVCKSLNITIGKHHDALCDARACAECMISIANTLEVTDIDELAEKLFVHFGQISYDGVIAPTMGDGDTIYSKEAAKRSYTALLLAIRSVASPSVAEDITVNKLSDGSTFSFRYGNSVLFKYVRGAYDFIRCQPFEEQAQVCEKLSYYADGDVKLPLNGGFNTDIFVQAMARRAEDIYIQSGGAGFGCCSYFMDCSDARACVFDSSDPHFRSCHYRRHLEEGRIFYGNNRNYFPEIVIRK